MSEIKFNRSDFNSAVEAIKATGEAVVGIDPKTPTRESKSIAMDEFEIRIWEFQKVLLDYKNLLHKDLQRIQDAGDALEAEDTAIAGGLSGGGGGAWGYSDGDGDVK